MLNIFYGRESIDKENFIYDNIGGRALLIVPDQFTLEAERGLFAQLGTEALIDIEVLSMSRLGYRLLEELGGSKRTFIDKYGRHMILSSVAVKERENLQVFKGLEGGSSFIKLVNDFITEMKQFNCGEAELAEIASSVAEGSYTQKKLQDLHLLYREYEKVISGKYTDSEDYIDLFISKIRSSRLIADNHIWIYGFDSFAPKPLAIIGELMTAASDVNVVLTYDDDRSARDSELFALSEMVIHNFEGLAERLGVELSKQRIPQSYAAGNKAAEIAFLERELYSLPARVFGSAGPLPAAAGGGCTGSVSENAGGCDSAGSVDVSDSECTACSAASAEPPAVTLLAAANLYNEAESAACYVRRLVRDFGYRFSDIKLICNDQEVRGPILKRVFKEYGIDLISDAKKDIMQSPVVRYIMALSDIIVEKYRTDTVMSMLKSGFCDLNKDELTELENYAIKYKIRGTMWKKPFMRGSVEYGEEGIGRLNEIRERGLALMSEFEAAFKEETYSAFIERLYKLLYDSARLPEKITLLMQEQQARGRSDLAEETAQIWGKVIGILDQMAEIMGEEGFSPAAFRDLLETGLAEVEIGVLPPTKDGLMMGTMQRTRTGEMRALLVVGANEGVLPNEKPLPGLFGSDEKALFKEKGIELCKLDKVRFLEERMGIYRNLSKPTEHLWVSYSMSDGDGSPIKPSGVFTKLTELFAKTPIARDVLNSEDDSELVGAGTAGLRHLTEALQTACEGQPLRAHWAEALSWYKQNDPEALEPIRQGIGFTNRQEQLGRQAAEALYTAAPPAALSLSPSRLERFARCPFSHFILYGLKPEERRIFELAPREIGDIYHECLRRLTQRLTRDGIAVTDPASPWMTVTREECRALVEEVIAGQAASYREGIFEAGNEEKYRTRRISDICEKVCMAVIEQVRKGEIISCAFEVPFGRGKRISPIVVPLEGGRRVYIEGKIDRVDYLPSDRVKIIDYKTGNESFSIDEAEAGYRLQLMLYLEAALEQEKKPAGVFYFKINEALIDASGSSGIPDDIRDKIKKSFKLDGVISDAPEVIRSVAGDFEGISDVVPIRINKEGEVSGTGKGKLLTDSEFDSLREKVSEKVGELCEALADGSIDIHPMKTKDTSACAYCKYKGICRFDTLFEACSYNII